MLGPYSQLSDYQTQVQQLVHDLASIDFNATDLNTYINAARTRVALDFHNVRLLQQNASLINNQEQYPILGGICGITITNPGNYPSGIAPTITISAPTLTGGVTATAQCILGSNNGVSAVFMTNYGSGYAPPTPTTVGINNPPSGVTATFSAGSPTATGIPIIENNCFDINSISVLWGIERYTMGWLPFTMFQAFCRQNLTLQMQPIVWTSVVEQNLFFVFPPPNQNFTCDIDFLCYPSPLVNNTDVDAQIVPPVNENVQFYAAHLAMLKLQQYEHADYYEKYYDRRIPRLQANRQDRRIPNIYKNARRRIARW